MKSRRGLVRAVTALCAIGIAGSGCYRFTFEQRPTVATRANTGGGPTESRRLVTYRERRPTYFNGFVGNGAVDVTKYCADPVRTALRVTATDVLLGVGTLLVYTPHTLYVTCAEPAVGGGPRSSR